LLQACGGGGGGDDGASAAASTGTTSSSTGTTTSPATFTSANTGSVSAAFVAGSAPRYQLASMGGQTFGNLSPFVQASSGAMTTLASTVLSGDSATKEISGDATYAMGRWVAGTVTRSSGAETLTGVDSRSYHYLAVNAPPAFPASGALTCDAGVFTAPTYVSGGSGTGTTGTASGSASLSFGAGGATVSGSISVTASGSSGSASLNSTAATVTNTAIAGAYLSGGAGSAVQIGDAAGGAYLVAASYATTLASGARYFGVAMFRGA
jgi:hypothetical protein